MPADAPAPIPNRSDKRLSRLLGDLVRDRRGSSAITFALALPMLVGFMALAIDVGYWTYQKRSLQNIADAAAVGGAFELQSGGDASSITAVATYDAERNGYDSGEGTITVNAPPTSGSLSGVETAVQVILGEPATLMFASMFIDGFSITAKAVANVDGAEEGESAGDCYDHGIKTGKTVTLGQDTTLSGSLCVYGWEKVEMGQSTYVGADVSIASSDEDEIKWGQGSQIYGTISEADLEPTLAFSISDIIDDLKDGVNLPSNITSVQEVDDLPNNLISGTAYIIDDSVSIDQDYSATDIIIAATGSISWGQDGAIRNSVDSCNDSSEINIGIFTTESIALGQDSVVEGVSLIATKNIAIGQDATSVNASMQAGETVTIGQDTEISGCEGGIPISGYEGGGGGDGKVVLAE